MSSGLGRWTRGSTSIIFDFMHNDPPFEHHLQDRLERLSAIGLALSAERDLNALLERIVLEARRFYRR